MRKFAKAMVPVLAVVSTACFAQSEVTIYGRVDLGYVKDVGSSVKSLRDGATSMLGFRGAEDLGGGLSVFFDLDHRFNADSGSLYSTAGRFWHGRSVVGVKAPIGQLTLGHEYTASALYSQLIADPWGWFYVPGGSGYSITGLEIARLRNDGAVSLSSSAGGFAGGIQVAEGKGPIETFQKNPHNIGVMYSGGPVTVGFGYEVTGVRAAATEKVWTAAGSYDLKVLKVSAMFGKGTTAADVEHKSWMVSSTAPLGSGELRAAYGELKKGAVKSHQTLSAGYFYSLSKRTQLYADFSRNAKLPSEKTGYDLGLSHNF